MFSNVTVICILFTSPFTFVPLLFIFLMICLFASFHALCCALPAAVMIQLSTMDHYCISYTASTRSAKQICYLIQRDLQLIEQLEGQDSSIFLGFQTDPINSLCHIQYQDVHLGQDILFIKLFLGIPVKKKKTLEISWTNLCSLRLRPRINSHPRHPQSLRGSARTVDRRAHPGLPAPVVCHPD